MGLLLALALGATGLLAETKLFILDSGKQESPPEMILVESEQSKGGKVFLQEVAGTQREVEESRILARLPVVPRPEDGVSRETAVAAINALLEAKTKEPALEKILQEEVEKWKARLDKLPSAEDPEALAKAEAAFVGAVAKAMPKAYDPVGEYSADQIQKQIAALEGLKKEFSVRAEEVNRLMESWKLEEKEQATGKKKFEGRWLSPDEWEKEKWAREKAAREAFLAKIQLPEVSPVLIGQGILLTALVGGAITALLGASFFFHGIIEIFRHRAWWKGTAWAVAGVLAIGLLGRAAGLLLAIPEPLPLAGNGNPEVLEEILWRQAGQNQALPAEIRVAGGDLNAWWQKRLRFAPLAVTEIVVLSTDGWKIQFSESGLKLDRIGHLLGHNFILRHELTFNRSEKGEDVYRVEATLGRLSLPPSLVLHSWEAWVRDVAKIATILPGAEGQGVERLEKGAVVITKK